MSGEPRAFLAVDHGTATAAVSLIGWVDGRWRLLGSTAAPAPVGPDPLASLLVGRLRTSDPELAETLRLGPGSGEPARLIARTVEPPVLAVVAASQRASSPLLAAASTSGWRTRPLALDGSDVLALARLLDDPTVDAVLAGASEPPGGDERGLLPELTTLVAAAAARRPDLTIVLAGGLKDQLSKVEGLAGSQRPGAIIVAPAATSGDPAGEPQRELLDGLRGGPDDGRRAMIRAAGTLAALLERQVEVVEVGHAAGTRIAAPPSEGPIRSAIVPGAALVPDDFGDPVVDGVLGWSTVAIDRMRLRDRLRELRFAPWGEAHGDGALLRLAAARAALARLIAATPSFAALPMPDLVVATGGAWQVAPGPAVALALADVLRRSGATGLALDHARLLGPLGTVADDTERQRLIGDLRDDLLAPIGSVVMPSGMRAARAAGHLVVHAAGGASETELVPGGLQLVDLPPGERAIVEFRFRDPVVLGARGRHFAVDVGGGLGGLLVDLRDVPLRLPERLERRRELLDAWQRALWSGLGS
jgi:hypothetical protein